MNKHKLNIRMDLLRAAQVSLDVGKPFKEDIVNTFLNKAKSTFDANLSEEKHLRNEIAFYQKQIPSVGNSNLKRIQWAEKVMTIASRLGTI